MKDLWRYVIIAVAVIVSAVVLAMAYTQRSRTSTGVITVTGLGETEFTSDVIVINGYIEVVNDDTAEAYRILGNHRATVIEFLKARGVADDEISFAMISTHKKWQSSYNNGDYQGEIFVGYQMSQTFTIESSNIDGVESAARELPSLMIEDIAITVQEPMYYYSQLESVKLDLIAEAAADARERAEKIAASSGSSLGDLASSRAGVFQITAATGDEEFSAGGSFNLSSRDKKARVTVRSEFKIDN